MSSETSRGKENLRVSAPARHKRADLESAVLKRLLYVSTREPIEVDTTIKSGSRIRIRHQLRLYLWQRALRDVHSAFEPQLVMEGRIPRGVTTPQEQDPSRQLTWVTVTVTVTASME